MCKSQLRLYQLWCLRFSIKRKFYYILMLPKEALQICNVCISLSLCLSCDSHRHICRPTTVWKVWQFARCDRRRNNCISYFFPPSKDQKCTHRHSFIHSDHFYSASSSPLLLRGAPRHRTDTVSEFHVEAPQATVSEGPAQGTYVAARSWKQCLHTVMALANM